MITLKDLKEYYSGMSEYDRDPVLFCNECRMEYSSSPGDYWMLPDNHEFTCSYCSGSNGILEPLDLVVKQTVYKKVM